MNIELFIKKRDFAGDFTIMNANRLLGSSFQIRYDFHLNFKCVQFTKIKTRNAMKRKNVKRQLAKRKMRVKGRAC